MSYAEYLKDLLRPMGVYRLNGTLNGAELECWGAAMDRVQAQLEEIHRQADLTTAGEEGLSRVESLFSCRPVTGERERLRAGLAALLRVSGDSFTQSAINDNLAGCGLNALVRESSQPQSVEIYFPEVPGIPEGFEQMKKIIEEILPCHLAVEYVFWYSTWDGIERRFSCWNDVEEQSLIWEELEKLVD